MERIAPAIVFLSSALLAQPAFATCSVNITSGPADPTSSTSAALYFTQSGCSGVGFKCKLDAGSYASCTSPKSYSSLSEASHTFSVKYDQSFPNADSHPDAWTWTIDTTAPTTTITSGPPTDTNDPAPTFTFSSNEAATFECRIDSGAWSACTSPHTTALLSEASHRFDVRAKDLAGTYDATPAGATFEVERFDKYSYSAMWALEAASLNLLNIALTATNAVLVQDVTAGSGAYGFAVDEGGDAAWVLCSDDVLRSYNSAGSLIEEVTPPTTPGVGDVPELVVDPEGGSVWIGYGTSIHNYSADGTFVRSITTVSDIKSLAFDIAGDRLLVAQADRITAHNDTSGAIAMTITLSGVGTPIDLAVDGFSRDLSVLTDTKLLGYTSEGTLFATTTVSGGLLVRVDGLGGTWVAETADLMHIENTGVVRATVQPFGATGGISGLTTDPFTGELWVAAGTEVVHLNESGSEIGYFERGGAISAIVLTHSQDYPPASITSDLTAGVRIAVINSAWTVTHVTPASGAWEQDIRLEDEVISINGVQVPSINPTLQDVEDFNVNLIAARSGGVDAYLVDRGGVQSTHNAPVASLSAIRRKGRTKMRSDGPLHATWQGWYDGEVDGGCFACIASYPGVAGFGCGPVDVGALVCFEEVYLPTGFPDEEGAEFTDCEAFDGTSPTCQQPGLIQ